MTEHLIPHCVHTYFSEDPALASAHVDMLTALSR